MQKFETIFIEKSKIVNCSGKGNRQIKELVESEGKVAEDYAYKKVVGKKHVAVVGAGMSSEREVSFMSSNGVVDSLIELGHYVTFIDMGADIAEAISAVEPDIVYNALHGTYGEDGCLSGLLNIMRIPYTGTGVLASSLAFNKKTSQAIFAANGIVIPEYVSIKKSDNIKKDPIPRPYVIKPLTQGSSIGIEVIFEEDNFDFANYDFPYGEVLVERYIKGRDLNVAVLNGKAMGILEVRLLPEKNKRFRDYEVKYSKGFFESLLPAPLPKDIEAKTLRASEDACRFLGCDVGMIRAEFMYDEVSGQVYMLELNTHPGMTPLSICPQIATLQGMDYTNLVAEVLKTAKFEE